MPEVKITGATILINKADLPIISDRKVWLTDGYPQIWKNQFHVRLARVIMGAQPGQLVDHVNGNKLDNRRRNLRLCTRRENGQNRQGPTSHNTSGYRGVNWNHGWFAAIKVDGKILSLGRFESKESAAKAWDKAALKYYGAFAGKLNFPQESIRGGK